MGLQKILKPTKYKAVDTSGNNNHGQIYSGRALEFDGVADELEIPGGSAGISGINAFEHTNGDAFTMACWINAASDSLEFYIGRNESSVLMFYIDPVSGGFKLGYRPDGSPTGNGLVDGADAGSGDSYFDFSTTALPLNTWLRVVYVGTGVDSTLHCYINGQLYGTLNADTKNRTNDFYFYRADLVQGYKGVQAHLSNIGSPYSTTLTYAYKGMMSDFQIWDSAWSASDVTYDYLNPESLALNNGGTSLTESNLKLWYPMQDGHRGQQSYILDGANTGLGDELATNADMNPDGAGWQFNNTWEGVADDTYVSNTNTSTNSDEAAYYTTFDGKQCLYLKSLTTTGNEVVDQSLTWVEGVTYKFHIRVWVVQNKVRCYQSNTRFQDNKFQDSTTTGEWEDVIGYLTCDSAGNGGFNIGMPDEGDHLECYIDFASCKPVNDKHHATTEFLGDNLYTAANALRVAADGTTADETDATTGWNDNGTSTFTTSSTNHSGSKSIVYEANVNHGGISTDLQPYLTVGRTYKLSLFVRHTTGGTAASDQSLRFSDASNLQSNPTEIAQIEPSDTTFTEVSREFVYDDDKYRYFGVKELNGDGSSGDGGLFMDTMYIKEVGVASGWTDADQQLDIPQTALQSYNQLAWFQDHLGENQPHASASHHNDFNPEAGDFTVSAWVMQVDTHDDNYFFAKGGGGTSGWHCRVETDGSIQFTVEDNDGSNDGTTFSLNLDGAKFDADDYLGEWWHFVGVINRSTDETSVYINGELLDTKDISAVNNPIEHSSGALKLGSWTATYGGGIMNGSATEFSVWKGVAFSQSDVNELYNDGKALDALTHTQKDYLKGYWRNNGLATWQDLTTNDRDVTLVNGRETLLLPAGVDASRDNQGFLMNRQKDTNSLNLKTSEGLTVSSDNNPDAVIIQDSTSFDHSDGTDSKFSVSLWFKANDYGSLPQDQVIMSKGTNNDGKREWKIILDDNSTTQLRLEGSSPTNGGSGNDLGYTLANLTDTDWHHIVVTYDGTEISGNEVVAYLDGGSALLRSDADAEIKINADDGNVCIGDCLLTNTGGDGFEFDGQIDDVCYYNRKILSATEAKRNYNAGKRSHR